MTDAPPTIRLNANGAPAIHGSRVNIYHIMDHYRAQRAVGWAAEFYGIPASDVVDAYAYIAEHDEELSERYHAIIQREQRGNSPEIEAKLAQSHDKLARLKEELGRKRSVLEGLHADRDTRAAG